MVQQVTAGIIVTVTTYFEGVFKKVDGDCYAFKYTVRIENNSEDVVRLTSRFWKITDALNNIETVEGEGVIGKKPVLHPGKSHTYSSGCLLQSPIGAMTGHYTMINFSKAKEFQVQIPMFKLHAPFALN